MTAELVETDLGDDEAEFNDILARLQTIELQSSEIVEKLTSSACVERDDYLLENSLIGNFRRYTSEMRDAVKTTM